MIECTYPQQPKKRRRKTLSSHKNDVRSLAGDAKIRLGLHT